MSAKVQSKVRRIFKTREWSQHNKCVIMWKKCHTHIHRHTHTHTHTQKPRTCDVKSMCRCCGPQSYTTVLESEGGLSTFIARNFPVAVFPLKLLQLLHNFKSDFLKFSITTISLAIRMHLDFYLSLTPSCSRIWRFISIYRSQLAPKKG